MKWYEPDNPPGGYRAIIFLDKFHEMHVGYYDLEEEVFRRGFKCYDDVIAWCELPKLPNFIYKGG